MLLALVVISQITAAFANPFHKYPFVFLLDVGNEELEKTNTEQIRVSLPGGSIALRYPAIGNGDPIVHVRVSGIDFGTDLKANIVDGGPGFNYVVLAFIGNPGVPYDAVITVQTLPYEKSVYSLQDTGNDDNTKNEGDSDPYGVAQDTNDSAEDTSDTESQYIEKPNVELTQSSSNVYNYAVNEVESNDQDTNAEIVIQPGGGYAKEDDNYDENDDEESDHQASNDYNDEEENIDEGKDIHKIAPEEISYNQDVEVEDTADNAEADQNGDLETENDDSEEDNEESKSIRVDSNLYSKYLALKPHLFNANVVPLGTNDEQSHKDEYQEESEDLDQMFNDEEIHTDEKYRDSNNNFDSDDSSAVAY